MTKTSVEVLALISSFGGLVLIFGLTGCAGDRVNQGASIGIYDRRTMERANNQSTDEGIEDSRTAERVREALAADSDYKYDGVKVTAHMGVVRLSGFVNTSAQRNSAGEVTGKVVGVRSFENNLLVKD
jgi:osmotically-inducible protein OsmY